jgi:hypothetical protein
MRIAYNAANFLYVDCRNDARQIVTDESAALPTVNVIVNWGQVMAGKK